MKARRLFFLLIFSFLTLKPLFSQEVHWDPASGEFEEGKTDRLKLVFEQCTPETNVELPEIDGLKFGKPSQNRQMEVINFKISQRFEYIYPIEPMRKGKFVIPEFEVLTSKGAMKVNEATFTVVESSNVNSGGSLANRGTTNKPRGSSDAVKSFLKAQPNIVWVGQVVDLIYELYVSSRYEGNLAGGPDWKPTGVTLEAWGDQQQNPNTFNGISYSGVRSRARAIFDESAVGATLPPLQQRLQIRFGGSGFFSFPQIEDINVKSAMGDIQIKPLPPAPPDFLKAVGQFKIKSTVVPKQVSVGEPVTWTLTLEGTGNWPMGISLPARDVSKDFRVLQPRANQTNQKDKLFDATLSEDVVLIPE
ncbi:MAG: BatD family protein, partial [Verrucomicrobiota bacterium]